MSKKSKESAKEKRKKDKRSRREANRVLWTSYAGKESNRKPKRPHGRRGARHTHPEGRNCGNIGCCRCSETARRAKVEMLALTSPVAARRALTEAGVTGLSDRAMRAMGMSA